ncbi:hypothetical protein [Niallia sp.]|uniref:hypothetical protein n=1 Tax=Niallia sp. TaxID=2837523 RepID=UPI0028A0AC19|nr:hypothetical protein [Niallia sp.]
MRKVYSTYVSEEGLPLHFMNQEYPMQSTQKVKIVAKTAFDKSGLILALYR